MVTAPPSTLASSSPRPAPIVECFMSGSLTCVPFSRARILISTLLPRVARACPPNASTVHNECGRPSFEREGRACSRFRTLFASKLPSPACRNSLDGKRREPGAVIRVPTPLRASTRFPVDHSLRRHTMVSYLCFLKVEQSAYRVLISCRTRSHRWKCNRAVSPSRN